MPSHHHIPKFQLNDHDEKEVDNQSMFMTCPYNLETENVRMGALLYFCCKQFRSNILKSCQVCSSNHQNQIQKIKNQNQNHAKDHAMTWK